MVVGYGFKMIKFQKHREMEFRGLLVELVRLLQPEVYCEIGVKKGYTFNAIAPLVKVAIGIDPAGFEWYPDKDVHNHSIKGHDKQPGSWYLHNQHGTRVHLYHMTSDKFAEVYPKGKEGFNQYKIDFLFIDGDHSAEQVKNDLLNFLPFVREDTGLIFLHDTYPVKPELAVEGHCHDAWKVADEISGYCDDCQISYCEPYMELEIVTIPGPWAGLSILRRKGINHLHWQSQYEQRPTD